MFGIALFLALVGGRKASRVKDVVGDFNGDTRSDMVVANSNGANVSVLLGNGDGTFQNHIEYAARGLPISILAADFNGDSKSDLVVAAQCPGCTAGISVLLGNGDGTFQARIDLDTASPQAIAVADFDLDGQPDLAVAIPFTSIAIFRGNGDGTFQFSTSLSAGNIPLEIQTGDFNNDSKPDLAAVTTRFRGPCFFPPCPPRPTPAVQVILNNSDGTFSVLGVGNADKFTLGDFDGDRNLDLAMSLSTSTTFDVLLGKDDGTFDAPLSFTSTLGTLAISADLNRDKAPDLVELSTAPNTIAVFLNAGTDFSISASNPTPSTISRGQSATASITVTLLNGFDNPVSFACSVSPAQAGSPTCSVNPASVTPAPNDSATATLIISTAGVAVSTMKSSWQALFVFGFLGVPLMGFVFLGVNTNTRMMTRLRLSLLGLALITVMVLQPACGGGGADISSQTYTVTVKGSSGSLERSTSFTITVN